MVGLIRENKGGVMRELSLFSGAGGGLLGSKLLGWTTVGYVEYEEYCQKVLRQRIADGILDAAPIFGDIRRFISEGYADLYRGRVDVVTGGFPCQPFSVAGKGLGEADPRNMWPQTIEVIRRVKPRFAFLENVPGLMGKPYFRTILRQIAESGYGCRWGVLGASDVGAPHRRKRLWILAYAQYAGRKRSRIVENQNGGKADATPSSGKDVANAERMRKLQPEGGKQDKRGRLGDCGQDVAHAKQMGCGKGATIGKGISDEGTHDKSNNTSLSGAGSWWLSEPNVGRVAHGVANRVDRLKAIGNGQVPLCMAYAFSKLFEGIIE